MTLSGLLLMSCAPLEILPGLCYTDRDGTYICPEKIDPPILDYDRNNSCARHYSHSQEEWMWCMDPDNDHIYDPYWKQRREIEREIQRRENQSTIRSIERVAQQSITRSAYELRA
jgi:hypothetical protein